MGFLDDYQPVEDRLREFYERHPFGRINTELIHHEAGDYIVKATIYLGDEVSSTPPKATGLAHDSTDSLPANMKASALEVCETSAIGRALANMGLAPKGARPSREEMQKASPVPQPQGENVATRATTGASPADDPGPVRAPDSLGESSAGATSEGVGLDGERIAYGEGAAGPSGAPAPSDDSLAALLEAVDGSETKAINAVNKAMHTAYKRTELETLEPEDWAAGLRLVRGKA